MKQRSNEWFEARKGKLTASNFGAALGISPYKSRNKLFKEMRGDSEPFKGNEMTAYGQEMEPVAIDDYECETGNLVQEVGFILHPDNSMIGASPDGLIGDNGSIEVKCPWKQEVYGGIPPFYAAQCYGVMACCERKWCDFYCWTPIDTELTRIDFSEDVWAKMYEHLELFLSWVKAGDAPPRMERGKKAEIEKWFKPNPKFAWCEDKMERVDVADCKSDCPKFNGCPFIGK